MNLRGKIYSARNSAKKKNEKRKNRRKHPKSKFTFIVLLPFKYSTIYPLLEIIYSAVPQIIPYNEFTQNCLHELSLFTIITIPRIILHKFRYEPPPLLFLDHKVETIHRARDRISIRWIRPFRRGDVTPRVPRNDQRQGGILV